MCPSVRTLNGGTLPSDAECLLLKLLFTTDLAIRQQMCSASLSASLGSLPMSLFVSVLLRAVSSGPECCAASCAE